MEPTSIKNHENRWLEALLDHLWHISGSKVVPGLILGRFGEAFWLHFGGIEDLWRHSGSNLEVIFGKKLTFVGVIFASFSERHFLRILIDFGAHFHDF